MTDPGSGRRRPTVVLVSFLVVVAFGAGVLVGTSLSDDEAALPEVDRSTRPEDEARSAPAEDDAAGGAVIPVSPTIGCPLYPENNYWHADVTDLPVHPESDTFIDSIGSDTGLHPDFGTEWEDAPIGIPYTATDDETPEVEVRFEYADESDPGPYMIPPDASIEGGTDSDGDRHVLVVNSDTCMLYELYNAFPESDTAWTADSGAIFDLTSNKLRPAEFTSADAAGLPILPGLVRYDEVATGEIDHALRFTVESTQDAFVWPARHQAGDDDDSLPPMGAWFRLRPDIELSGFSPEVRLILEAMQKHGLILADNGGPMFVSGVPDERWNDETLAEMSEVTASDFELIDATSLMVDPDSGEVGG